MPCFGFGFKSKLGLTFLNNDAGEVPSVLFGQSPTPHCTRRQRQNMVWPHWNLMNDEGNSDLNLNSLHCILQGGHKHLWFPVYIVLCGARKRTKTIRLKG